MLEKVSRQIFEFARKRESFSNSTLQLMCVSASYVLHVVAKFDEVTAKDIESAWHLEDRSKVFSQMKVSLSEWIARQDVIGGASFGGNIPKYDKIVRGKRELQVHQTIIILYLIIVKINVLQLWNALLSIDGATRQTSDDWKNIIKQIINKRIHHVVCLS